MLVPVGFHPFLFVGRGVFRGAEFPLGEGGVVTLRRLVAYGVFSLLFFASYLLVVSLYAFFHFILGHRFNLIEIWIQENIWLVMSSAKALSFFLVYQYYRVQNLGVSLKEAYLSGFWEKEKKKVATPSEQFYVVIVFLLLFFVVQLKPAFNGRWSLLPMVIQFIGHFIYLVTDFFMVSYLIRERPFISSLDKILTLVFSCFLFGVMAYTTIPSRENFSLFFVFQFFLMLFFDIREKTCLAALWILLLFNGVFGVIFSLSLFDEQHWGFFYFTQDVTVGEMALAFLLVSSYLRWRRVQWAGKENRVI